MAKDTLLALAPLNFSKCLSGNTLPDLICQLSNIWCYKNKGGIYAKTLTLKFEQIPDSTG